MKRFLIPGTALLAMAAATGAYAQSSVTLYGTIDDGPAYYNNTGGHSVVTLQKSALTTNAWGLRGTEDLGGGMAAVFRLENGFDINTGKLGQGGREFGKYAWVGLTDRSYGAVRMGRQVDVTVDLVGPLTGDVYGPFFSTPGDVDNNDHTFRVQNAVKYTSPTMGGFQFEAMYGLGGVAGDFTSQGASSAGFVFTQGGFSTAAAYVYTRNDGAGGVGTADATANNSVSPLYGSVAFVGSRMLTHAAVQYTFGAFTANIRYSNSQWKPYANFLAFNQKETFNVGAAFMHYRLTPALDTDLGYTYMRSSGGSSATYQNIAAGAEYSLSKRTTAYVIGAYSHAKGTTFSQDGKSLVAAGGNVGDVVSTSSTPNQLGVVIGLTTRF